MINSQDYIFHSEYLPLYIPNTYYYEVRDVALYPFPARHPDTVAILCLWFSRETDAGERTYELSYSLNAHGYRIAETMQTGIEDKIDLWLSRVRVATEAS